MLEIVVMKKKCVILKEDFSKFEKFLVLLTFN